MKRAVSALIDVIATRDSCLEFDLLLHIIFNAEHASTSNNNGFSIAKFQNILL